MEGGAGDGGLGEALGGAQRLIGCSELLAVDVIAGEVGFCSGLPGEVDGGAGACGNGDETGGNQRGKGVVENQGNGRGGGASQLELMAVEGDGTGALGSVGVGFALTRGGVGGSTGVGLAGGGFEVDLGGVGRR